MSNYCPVRVISVGLTYVGQVSYPTVLSPKFLRSQHVLQSHRSYSPTVLQSYGPMILACPTVTQFLQFTSTTVLRAQHVLQSHRSYSPTAVACPTITQVLQSYGPNMSYSHTGPTVLACPTVPQCYQGYRRSINNK